MADVSATTDVFASGADGRAISLALMRKRPLLEPATATARVLQTLESLSSAGWKTSLSQLFGDESVPMVYETGFAHSIDCILVLEANSLADSYEGIDLLEAAGWNSLFETEWLVGPREFQPVPSPSRVNGETPWAFFALWEWNDGWQRATELEREAYDRECDHAFQFDVGSGISIAGRHRLDAQSSWHHLGMWQSPSFEHIADGIAMHEEVADLMFTTSRHFVGKPVTASEYFGRFQ